MTREEAIEYLNGMKIVNPMCNELKEFANERNEVIDLAIESLSAEAFNRHEVACILAEAFGDECACNYNSNDEWLPYYCDFAQTCCPNPVGVACWEQYLKHKERRKECD